MNYNIKYLKKPSETTVMIHSADEKLTINHVEWWLPVLKESGINFSILVRDKENFKKLIKKYPFLQILYAKSPVDVETVVNAQPNLKVVLYPTNRAKNIHLLRFINYKHIFIGTKNSDWLSKINKSYRAYDEMWISGEYQYKKVLSELEDLRHLKLIKVGKPQIKNRLKKTKAEDIAYLPSLDNNEFSSFYKILHNFKQDIKVKILNDKIDDSIIKEFNIINHKNNFKFVRDKSLFEEELIFSKAIITDLPNLDIWLFSYDKPVFIYLPQGEKFIHKKIPEEIVTTFSNIDTLSLKEDEKIKENREKFVEDMFGKSFTMKNLFIAKLKEEVKE